MWVYPTCEQVPMEIRCWILWTWSYTRDQILVFQKKGMMSKWILPQCCGLSVKCSPLAYVFEHSVPKLFGKVGEPLEGRFSWKELGQQVWVFDTF